MKNTITKLSVVLCLILVSALTFTACREKSVYAENSDFESYPEYWNSFNDSSDDTEGEIYLPDGTVAVTASGRYLKMPLDKILNECNENDHDEMFIIENEQDPEYI